MRGSRFLSLPSLGSPTIVKTLFGLRSVLIDGLYGASIVVSLLLTRTVDRGVQVSGHVICLSITPLDAFNAAKP